MKTQDITPTATHRTDNRARRQVPDGPVKSQATVQVPTLEVDQVSVVYGRRVAVRDVSLTLGVGVTGLLGPNGAGKSSLMRVVVGLRPPDTGSVTVTGIRAHLHPRDARAVVGFVPERTGLPPDMAVEPFLRHAAQAKGLSRATRSGEVARVCERLGLEPVRDRVLGNLSKGYRQRVAVAQALLGDPRVLVFDEPTSGVDPPTVADLYQLISELGQSRVVLLSTHVMADVRAVCHRVVMVDAGSVIWDGPTAGVGAVSGPVRSRVTLRPPPSGTPDPLVWPSGVTVEHTAQLGGDAVQHVLVAENAAQVSLAISTSVRAGWDLISYEPLSDGLTEFFRAVTVAR